MAGQDWARDAVLQNRELLGRIVACLGPAAVIVYVDWRLPGPKASVRFQLEECATDRRALLQTTRCFRQAALDAPWRIVVSEAPQEQLQQPITPQQPAAISSWLKKRTIHDLSMVEFGDRPEGAGALLGCCPALKRLITVYHDLQLDPGWAVCQGLTELHLSPAAETPWRAASPLMQALAGLRRLEVLHLGLGEGSEAASGLTACVRLTRLRLAGSGVHPPGPLPALEVLRVYQDCQTDDTGGSSLVAWASPKLSSMSFYGCVLDIQAVSGPAGARPPVLSALRTLTLGRCRAEFGDGKALQQHLCQLTALSLMSHSSQLPRLGSLPPSLRQLRVALWDFTRQCQPWLQHLLSAAGNIRALDLDLSFALGTHAVVGDVLAAILSLRNVQSVELKLMGPSAQECSQELTRLFQDLKAARGGSASVAQQLFGHCMGHWSQAA